MTRSIKRPRISWISSLSLLSILSLLTLQSLWLYNSYQLVYTQLTNEANEAFKDAYAKEQGYRTPPINSSTINSLTVLECGGEEVRIVRHCPVPDTIIYRNIYGRSLETVISRAFYELREKSIPLNIHCLSDLFAGTLFEHGIQANFVIEKWDTAAKQMLGTNDMSGKVSPQDSGAHVLTISISETEELRAMLHFEQMSIFRRMTGMIITSLLLLLITIACLAYQLRFVRKQSNKKEAIAGFTNELLTRIENIQGKQPIAESTAFKLGQYTFDAEKNELSGFGCTITLNKKENAILLELCSNTGKVVERNMLLERYWNSTGLIYSRSLDTYIARLRGYLKEDPSVQITTIKGLGYKLSIPE